MDSALAWIGQLADWVGRFVPRWIILDTTEGAVKYVRGRKVRVLKAGVHWYWPATTKITEYPIVRQADDLRAQTVTTVDDKTIIVGGLLVYSVDDLEKLVAHTYSPASTVTEIALSAIHDVCCRMTWEELKNEQRRGTLDTKLRNVTQKNLTDYGVKVIKTMLTDLAQTRVYKLMQTMSTDQ